MRQRERVKWFCGVAALGLTLCMTVTGLCGAVTGFAPAEAAPAQQITAEAAETVDMSKLLNMDELTGWASVAYRDQDGVTGGGNATPQIVTTRDEFAAAVSGSTPRVVVVSGTINAITDSGSAIQIGSNKTIVGIDKNAKLHGGINFSGQSNVIVSNLTMEGCNMESHTPDDVMNVDGSDHIWFNHLNIYDGGDGNLDIKGGSNYITVSWCKFWYTIAGRDHRLSCLIGSGAGDHDDTDYGKLKVTYHHNWFADLCDQRMPRVMYGQAHVYNNYYSCSGNDYCIGVDCYASVLVENNYFYKVKDPHRFMYDTNKMPATITARGNEYDGTSGRKDNGAAPDKIGAIETFDDPPYAYVLDDAKSVPDMVQKYAGPQDYDPSATPVPTATPKPVTEPTPKPTAKPALTPTAAPKPPINDNPFTRVTDSEKGEAIQMNGQNSDGTNGYLEIDNPFAGKDFSETQSGNGYPQWTKGVTISYWQYIPSGVSQEAAVINFSGTHRAVCARDWPLYVEGIEDGYQNRFEDNGGTYSKISEGNVTSGLQISSYASFGFSEDNVTAIDLNPYGINYGNVLDMQGKNYLYYFANTSGTRSKLVSEKGKWHFVAIVIQNDLISNYVDGEKVSWDAFNYWGKSLTSDSKYSPSVSGQAFNLGYGWSVYRRASYTSDYFSHGMTILDFLSHENTKMYLGGESTCWESLGQNGCTTPSGIRLADVKTYDTPLTSSQIKALMGGTDPDVTPAPTNDPGTTATPRPTAEPAPVPTNDSGTTATPRPTAEPAPDTTDMPVPTPGGLLGDANGNGEVTAEDALLVLKHVVKLTTVDEAYQKLADVNRDAKITAEDALMILKYVVKLIEF